MSICYRFASEETAKPNPIVEIDADDRFADGHALRYKLYSVKDGQNDTILEQRAAGEVDHHMNLCVVDASGSNYVHGEAG